MPFLKRLTEEMKMDERNGYSLVGFLPVCRIEDEVVAQGDGEGSNNLVD